AQARAALEDAGAARLPPLAHFAQEAALCRGILRPAVQEEEGQALYRPCEGASGDPGSAQRFGPGARDPVGADRRRRDGAQGGGRSVLRLGPDQRLAPGARGQARQKRAQALGEVPPRGAVLGVITAIDPARAADYPANVQAILKRQAPCSAWLNQQLLEIDAETGFARIAYELGEAHFNRFGALHGGAIACVMDDALAVAAGLVLKWGEIAPTLEMKVSYLSQGGA